MNDKPSLEQTKEGIQASKSIDSKALIRFFVFLFLLPVILFLTAARLNWPMGWVYVGIYLVFTVISTAVVGLNVRFGWPPKIFLLLQLAGLVVLVLGNLFVSWVLVENKFFSAVVRIHKVG